MSENKETRQTSESRYVLEKSAAFSSSGIWNLQREYFEKAGVNAWRDNQVPHYITSNPVMGRTCAEITLGFLEDLASYEESDGAVYLLELGGGHGRFCHYFLKFFLPLYLESSAKLPSFRYIFSDFIEENIAFCRNHKALSQYIEEGFLDFARFDAEIDTAIRLELSSEIIDPQNPCRALIVTANYFFDTIPQELFYIKDKTVHQALLKLYSETDPSGLAADEVLEQVQFEYNYREAERPVYQEPCLEELLESYSSSLDQTHLLFPHAGIRCVERLRRLSRQGLMLLCADRGYHREEDLSDRVAPSPARHGSFSLSVNFHAFKQHCLNQKGTSLLPGHHTHSLILGAFVFGRELEFKETISAYEHSVNDFCPDDFFTLKKTLEKSDNMSIGAIMSALRLSAYDPWFFTKIISKIHDVVPQITERGRQAFLQTLSRIGDMYYHLGEKTDAPLEIGLIFFKLGFYQEAIGYFDLSGEMYGYSRKNLEPKLKCYLEMGSHEKASQLMEQESVINQLKAGIAEVGENNDKESLRDAEERNASAMAFSSSVAADENAAVLERELSWFSDLLDMRINKYFDDENPEPRGSVDLPPIQDLKSSDTWHGRFVNRYGFSEDERLVLMLALAPEVRPQLLDIFFSRNQVFDRGFTEFGGIAGKRHSGFIPTVQTALFLLAGDDLERSFYCARFFEHTHPFRKHGLLDLDIRSDNEPFTAAPLRLSRDAFSLITKGRYSEPEYNSDFPAKKIETLMEWDDLILSPGTGDQLSEIRAWLDHGHELLSEWKLEKHVRPGYRALFYGPPGTGKTLTACLLGKLSDRPVFRIDLSQLVSKYIGETEKNLEKVFKQAEQKDWILFFDEADSLFGKRTQISDAHDRYANQGTAYLLQRIEDCPNVIILASNLKSNLDEAFLRRFQSVVYFPMPEKRERLRLWRGMLSSVAELDKDIDLSEIASKYELSGGAIVNALRYCALMAIRRKSKVISHNDLLSAIQREYSKEGRTI